MIFNILNFLKCLTSLYMTSWYQIHNRYHVYLVDAITLWESNIILCYKLDFFIIALELSDGKVTWWKKSNFLGPGGHLKSNVQYNYGFKLFSDYWCSFLYDIWIYCVPPNFIDLSPLILSQTLPSKIPFHILRSKILMARPGRQTQSEP